jgi:hypothetical protein
VLAAAAQTAIGTEERDREDPAAPVEHAPRNSRPSRASGSVCCGVCELHATSMACRGHDICALTYTHAGPSLDAS